MSSCATVPAAAWACAIVDGALVLAANGSAWVFEHPEFGPSSSGDVIGCFTPENGTLSFAVSAYGPTQ